MLMVVDDAKLSGRHSMHRFVGMHRGTAIIVQFECGGKIFRSVANLEGNAQSACCLWRVVVGLWRQCEPVEVVDRNILHIGRLWVIAMTDVENVALHILLHHKPWPTT